MEGDGVVVGEQGVDGLCQNDYGQQRSDAAGNQDGEIQVADAVDERRVQAKRHQQGRKAHARGDDA